MSGIREDKAEELRDKLLEAYVDGEAFDIVDNGAVIALLGRGLRTGYDSFLI